MIFVADAGPILHLFWVGASSWALPPGPIDVVEAVWREVAAHAPQALDDSRFRRVVAPAENAAALDAWRLDSGERAALSYALSQQATEDVLVLCDEREARRACIALSLAVTGSLGLIVEGFRAERATREVAVVTIRDLPVRGRLHLSAELIEQVITSL